MVSLTWGAEPAIETTPATLLAKVRLASLVSASAVKTTKGMVAISGSFCSSANVATMVSWMMTRSLGGNARAAAIAASVEAAAYGMWPAARAMSRRRLAACELGVTIRTVETPLSLMA